MSQQPSFFDAPRPYPLRAPEPRRDGHHPGFHTVDPTTSREAIASHRASGKKAAHEELVIAALAMHDGSTGAELAEYLPFDKYETRRRLSDLNGDRRVRHGESRKCVVAGTNAVTWWLS